MKSMNLNSFKFITKTVAIMLLFFSFSDCFSQCTWTSMGTGDYNTISWTKSGSCPAGSWPDPMNFSDNDEINIETEVTYPTTINKFSTDKDITVNVESIFEFKGSQGLELDNGGLELNITNGLLLTNNGNILLKQGKVTITNGGIQMCNAGYKDETDAAGQGTYENSPGGYVFVKNSNIEDSNNTPSGRFDNLDWCIKNGNGVDLPNSANCAFFPGGANFDCDNKTFYQNAFLPVELFFFDAAYIKKNVQLQWETASELNNEGFEIEHSLDNRSWKKAAFIQGHGTTLQAQSYSYKHQSPPAGINYYRLKQMDFDGTFEYSKIVSVKVEREDGTFTLFPNPVSSGPATLAISTDYSGQATFKLFDLTGKQIAAKPLIMEEGFYQTDIQLQEIPAGMYIAELQAGSERWKKRLVVK